MLDGGRFGRVLIWSHGAFAAWLAIGGAWPPIAFSQAAKSSAPPRVATVTPAGAALYAPGKWGAIGVSLSNPGDEEVELLATTYFTNEPTLQFGRRVRIPPRSRLRIAHPIRLPEQIADGGKRAHYQTLVMPSGGDREVLIRSDSGRMETDGTLPCTDKAPITGILDSLDYVPRAEGEAAVNLLNVMQHEELGFAQNTLLTDRIFVPGEEGLDALNQLVILDSRVADDEAGLAAIRRWLFGGGRLWVLLDHVDANVLERLLGDKFTCEVVDRVGLTTIQLEPGEGPGGGARSTGQHDYPVTLVRTIVSDVDVAYTVDGWPAAFWKTCGEGRLLVTTLGPRGWVRPKSNTDPSPPADGAGPIGGPDAGPAVDAPVAATIADGLPLDLTNVDLPDPQRHFVPLDPMKGLAAVFFSARPEPLLPPTSLAPQVREYVGYSLPPRWQIIGLLVGFLVLVGVVGASLVRTGRLEFLGALGPVLALAVSAGLVVLGRGQRQVIPPTVASIQFVQPLAGTDDVRTAGLAGVYSPDGGTAATSGTRGGWVMPEMSGVEGTTRRMIWTDLDHWQWEQLPEIAGLRSAEFRQSATIAGRVEATATFGPQGVVGRWQAGDGRRGSDAVLAARDGRIGVELHDDGTFAAPASQTLTPDQFLAAGILNDEQVRRRQTLEHLLAHPQRPDFPESPLLLLWTDRWDTGFDFGDDRRRLGSALVSIPLRWQRPPTGTYVTIPGPLLPYRATIGPDGAAPSGLWDYRRRHWERKATPSATWLRFQVPRTLLPVSVDGGRLEIQVSGPVGRLEVAGHRDGGAVPLETWRDPVGTVILEIDRGDLLPVEADGGLLLRLSAGDPDRPHLTRGDGEDAKVSYWQIESLQLELTGRTVDAP